MPFTANKPGGGTRDRVEDERPCELAADAPENRLTISSWKYDALLRCAVLASVLPVLPAGVPPVPSKCTCDLELQRPCCSLSLSRSFSRCSGITGGSSPGRARRFACSLLACELACGPLAPSSVAEEWAEWGRPCRPACCVMEAAAEAVEALSRELPPAPTRAPVCMPPGPCADPSPSTILPVPPPVCGAEGYCTSASWDERCRASRLVISFTLLAHIGCGLPSSLTGPVTCTQRSSHIDHEDRAHVDGRSDAYLWTCRAYSRVRSHAWQGMDVHSHRFPLVAAAV